MKKEDIVVNTLVFLEDLKLGVPQVKLMDTLQEIGMRKIEIRREFIKNFDEEIPSIREKALSYNMEVYYSVPGTLYESGEVKYKTLTKYFTEARDLNCHKVKLCIGDYLEVKEEDVQKINHLCDEYNILLTIENDQTSQNGRSDKIYQFLEECNAYGSKIKATFDIGNWTWQKEDPMANADKLKQYVTYIHLKDVKGGERPQVTLLDEGDVDWREILRRLPEVPLALEYPCGTSAAKQLLLEISKLTETN